jgi:dTDP-4-amino-4,6-dideoxygalactose transaminase
MGPIPYSRQQVTEEDIAAVAAVLRSDFLTQGPEVPAFEEAFARRHAVAHAVSVSNATAGLHIACLALGVGPGSLVWTTPNTFLASANCARYCGADVGFVDMDPATRNISVEQLAARLEQAQRAGRLPDVVVPVDFSGLPCDLREIRQLADRYGFRILQDASHAAGASYLGAPVGSAYADVSVFSFHAVKIVTTAEGGMVTTQDAALARAAPMAWPIMGTPAKGRMFLRGMRLLPPRAGMIARLMRLPPAPRATARPRTAAAPRPARGTAAG